MTDVKTQERAAKPATPATMPPDRPPAPPQTGSIVEIPLTVGETRIDFSVRDGGTGPVFLCLGVRKSGSTMLHRITSTSSTCPARSSATASPPSTGRRWT